jgi:hypothetical protein
LDLIIPKKNFKKKGEKSRKVILKKIDNILFLINFGFNDFRLCIDEKVLNLDFSLNVNRSISVVILKLKFNREG